MSDTATPTKTELLDQAKALDISGRSSMNADELAAAIAGADKAQAKEAAKAERAASKAASPDAGSGNRPTDEAPVDDNTELTGEDADEFNVVDKEGETIEVAGGANLLAPANNEEVPIGANVIQTDPYKNFNSHIARDTTHFQNERGPLLDDQSRIDGSSNRDRVTAVQALLASTGAGTQVDGQYGRATRAAVTRFQADNGLEETGVVDKATFTALAEAVVNDDS